MHLLLFTVPGGAALVTLAFLGYMLAAEGLSTRIRRGSFTWIDQARGQAACWSRLSYYAGLSPSGGLSFPADVAVLPLAAEPTRMGAMGSTKTIDWDDAQHWSAKLAPRPHAHPVHHRPLAPRFRRAGNPVG